MIALLGHSLIVLALLVALAGSALSFLGAWSHQRILVEWGRRAALAVFGLVVAATGVMVFALVSHDFSVKYVSDIGSRDTPLYYTVISLWGALEGSILFWAFLLTGYTSAFLIAYRDRFAEIRPYVTGILLALASFFLFLIAGPSNPFIRIDPAGPAPGCPQDGCGPNPLLQNHPMMGLHPPLLYLGYVGLAVPYAIAMASLMVGSAAPDVIRLVRRWALVSWTFLSLGIVAGMWWSYAVLGWGGYWSWDPVENASVMPWLVTTAFLHSLQVQERRRMLKTWTVSLVIVAFILSVLGTFLTRSGVIDSVHSFTQSSVGPIFLGFLALVLVLSLGLVLARSEDLAAPRALEAVLCRETAFLFNNLLLVAITFTILLGTLFPLIAEALRGQRLAVGAPYFDSIAVPIGIALIFLMGIGPALPWGATRLEELQYRLVVPTAAGMTLILFLLALGIRGVTTLGAFGLVAFALTVTADRLVSDVKARRRSVGEGWRIASGRLFRANPRRYGGYLVHVGVLLVVVGIAASQSYQVRTTATLRPGQHLAVDGYTLTFLGLRPRPEPNRMVLGVEVAMKRGTRPLGTAMPSQNVYPTLEQPVVTPSVREQPWDMLAGLAQGRNPLPDLAELLRGNNPFEDVYLVPESINNVNANTFRTRHDGSVTLQVLVNPLVGVIWLGGLIVGLGGALALVPSRSRRWIPARAAEPRQMEPERALT